MTGTARARSRGPTCSAVASGAGCAPRCSPSATAHWGSGKRCATCSPTRKSSGGWWHKIGNVLAALPKSAHKDAKAALAEIYNAEDRDHAEQAAKAFAAAYGAKWPKAVAKITNDLDVLLAFYDFPGEHWIHLRTTNPIESTFATVRLRQRVTKGPGSRAAGIAMAFKLIESAQHRWRAVNSAHLVALVRAGAKFENGVLVERPDESTSGDTPAA
jgi:transposase-like protein